MAVEPGVACLHPDPGKQGTTIPRWKYDLVHAGLLELIPFTEEGIPFGELSEQLEKRLPSDALERLGSIMWYTVTVKLDMEARGEIERIPRKKPQHIRRK